MKSERKSSNQDLKPTTHRHHPSIQPSNLKCSKCKPVPKKPRSNTQQKVSKAQPTKPRPIPQQKPINKSHSKSMYDAWQDSFEEEEQSARKREMKRQSNSYCKFLNEKSQYDESTMLDNFFEQKYKESQNQLLNTKSKLFENECQVDSLQAELKKLRRENKMLHEKVKSLDQDNQQLTKKSQKYKQLARTYKSNLTQATQSLDNLKRTRSDEINVLSQSVSMMEKLVKQRSFQYVTNLKTIQNYLIKIQKMIVPSDQNYSFNQKVLGDLTDLCSQLTKMTFDEEQSLKESLSSNYNSQFRTNPKEEVEFIFSQTTTNEFNTLATSKSGREQDFSTKTRKLLDDYEKLRYESEYIKKENVLLKAKNDEISFLINESQYNTNKQSRNHKQQPSLSVNDLIQLDSVCQVNSKLEVKNQYLEEQIIMMKVQMSELIKQTQELQNKQRQESESSIETQKQVVDAGIQDQAKTRKIQISQFQYEGKTQRQFPQQDVFLQQLSPSEGLSDLCTYEKESTMPPFSRNHNQASSTKKYMRPFNSTSHIDSSRGGLSKLTSASNSRRKNVFKRNCYLDSEKENLTSARDNPTSTYLNQQQLIHVFNYDEQSRPSFANTLNSTSPSVFGGETHGKSFRDKLNRQNTQVSMNTFKKPMSMGSTTTLMINEKAKNLRNEITTLDEEIVLLQDNLKKAIKKKDSKTRF